jgi:hypothetical protein
VGGRRPGAGRPDRLTWLVGRTGAPGPADDHYDERHDGDAELQRRGPGQLVKRGRLIIIVLVIMLLVIVLLVLMVLLMVRLLIVGFG